MKRENSKFISALSKEHLLNTIPSGLFLVDHQRYIVSWNREAERLTGYSAEEIIGQHCSILEGIECDQGCRLYDAGSPKKPIMASECHIRTKSGKEIVISKNIDLLQINGEVVGGVETFIDITSQKKMENESRLWAKNLEKEIEKRVLDLQEERLQLRSVLDSMMDMAYIVTQDLHIDFFNQAMLEAFGPDLEGHCYEVIYGYSNPCQDCPWEEVRQGQTVIDERAFRRGGRIFEVIHTPVYDVHGELQKLTVCRNITERKEVSQKLKELNQSLDSFVSSVSHDLRSPLTPIIGCAEILLDQYSSVLDERGTELVQTIHRRGYLMLNLIEDLLEFSCLDQTGPDRPINPNQVIEQVLLDNQAEIRAKNVLVKYGDLPEISIQETLLYQLFNNLILNAIRYGCEKDGSVEIAGHSENKAVVFTIADHGPGIPPEEREKVFEIFYRGSQAKQEKGTGIGLATVQKVVRLYSGTILIEETPGGGCTVKITFPK